MIHVKINEGFSKRIESRVYALVENLDALLDVLGLRMLRAEA